jgi:hypothetical protein
MVRQAGRRRHRQGKCSSPQNHLEKK